MPIPNLEKVLIVRFPKKEILICKFSCEGTAYHTIVTSSDYCITERFYWQVECCIQLLCLAAVKLLKM